MFIETITRLAEDFDEEDFRVSNDGKINIEKDIWNKLTYPVQNEIRAHNNYARHGSICLDTLMEEELDFSNTRKSIVINRAIFRGLSKETRDKIVRHNKAVKNVKPKKTDFEPFRAAMKKGHTINVPMDLWRGLSKSEKQQIKDHNRVIHPR